MDITVDRNNSPSLNLIDWILKSIATLGLY